MIFFSRVRKTLPDRRASNKRRVSSSLTIRLFQPALAPFASNQFFFHSHPRDCAAGAPSSDVSKKVSHLGMTASFRPRNSRKSNLYVSDTPPPPAALTFLESKLVLFQRQPFFEYRFQKRHREVLVIQVRRVIFNERPKI